MGCEVYLIKVIFVIHIHGIFKVFIEKMNK